MMEFYKVLEKIMKNKDLTIPEVARLCNLSDSTVRSIFTRKQKTVALNIAFKIADGLCIPLITYKQKARQENPDGLSCVFLRHNYHSKLIIPHFFDLSI